MFTVNSPECDWFTLTSFSPKIHERIEGMEWLTWEWKEAKVRGYEGKRQDFGEGNGNLFLLEGVQKKKPHFIAQATGGGARRFLPVAVEILQTHQSKFTRLDLQVTVPMPRSTKFRGRWLWKVFPEKATVVGSGLDVTLYPSGFGCTSDTTWRIYVKRDKRECAYLRFEVMLRGKHAKAAGELLKRGVSVASIYKPLFETLLKRHASLASLSESRRVTKVLTSLPVPLIVESAQRDTMRWIKDVAIMATWKYLNSHDTPQENIEEVYKLLENLLWGRGIEEGQGDRLGDNSLTRPADN